MIQFFLYLRGFPSLPLAFFLPNPLLPPPASTSSSSPCPLIPLLPHSPSPPSTSLPLPHTPPHPCFKPYLTPAAAPKVDQTAGKVNASAPHDFRRGWSTRCNCTAITIRPDLKKITHQCGYSWIGSYQPGSLARLKIMTDENTNRKFWQKSTFLA